ncbi:MAG TPA: TIGR02452 family protein, partial [Myxococcota bacterium]
TVTDESTGDAARRLFGMHGDDVVALNFASARNPGGGFLGGAKAQEEDLARCSALYPTQLTQRDYYGVNRRDDDLVYSDHIIVSPSVPFFRDRQLRLVDVPYLVTIVTAPAPNAGEVLRRDPTAQTRISTALRRRARLVLAAAARSGARHLVLGAWGCGVFRNDPVEVASVFATLLDEGWACAYSSITFAVLDRSKAQTTVAAFRAAFAA